MREVVLVAELVAGGVGRAAVHVAVVHDVDDSNAAVTFDITARYVVSHCSRLEIF